MQNKKLIRFVESFLLLPIVTVSMPLGIFSNPKVDTETIQIPQIVLAQQENIEAINGLLAFNQELDRKAEILRTQAEAIDAYYRKYNMPLEGTGMIMAKAAQENGLDWRLLPAISVIESTGGIHACKNATHSFMGWGSCKINFNSDKEAIEIIAQNLGGNDPDTDHHYAGKSVKEILQKYNPPSIVPNYANKVMKVMKKFGPDPVEVSVSV
jgi:hypothetical protein